MREWQTVFVFEGEHVVRTQGAAVRDAEGAKATSVFVPFGDKLGVR